ncbi:MAG: hypothetical protein IPP91_15685 [Betaproteobacteria bacterium]|nr:hypothetical protein [Betaproteobacteria bacterium]
MNAKSILFVIGATVAFESPAQMPGYDMAVIKKWEDAKVIRFVVVGVHDARAMVVFGDYEGKADVTDRITVEFVWNKKARRIIGDVKVTDSKTTLKNIKSDGTNCPPPQLKGDYEHFQYVSQSADPSGQIMLKGFRTYPPASVSQYPASCKQRPIPGGKEDKFLTIGPADPVVLGMTLPPGGPFSISADKKTFSMKGAENWVWTYLPTVVP